MPEAVDRVAGLMTPQCQGYITCQNKGDYVNAVIVVPLGERPDRHHADAQDHRLDNGPHEADILPAIAADDETCDQRFVDALLCFNIATNFGEKRQDLILRAAASQNEV